MNNTSGTGFATYDELKGSLKRNDPAFVPYLRAATEAAVGFAEALSLNTLRKRAAKTGLWPTSAEPVRLAMVGGCNLRPLADLVEHFAAVLMGRTPELWVGDYDNYVSEIRNDGSELYAFAPELVFLLPTERRCRFTGSLTSTREDQQAEADRMVLDLLSLAEHVHKKSGAEVVLGNFRLPPSFDPGPMRTASLGSEYTFRKWVNLQLGLKLPPYAHLCDIEFLANRLGTLRSTDERTWFESKQPFSSELMVGVAREFAVVAAGLKRPAKKVAVLDLDNTLWGGVIGDDGLEGIEIGTTSPRGEAFKAFQQTLLELSRRGVLLAVCSKNDHRNAIEPFAKHPEMVLRLGDIVSFQANWEPKSDNLRRIALELNVGLDSLVFFDDNPAEIDIVRQFVPEVTAVWLGDDPSTFAATVKDSRLFEPRSITGEDLERVKLYKQEARRQEAQSAATDMDSYLQSLEMVATIEDFTLLDVPRITQLINKSNQFNLTTRRRTETEVRALCSSSAQPSFTMRLADRHGEHGLIAIVITKVEGRDLAIDTWLMSCRVLSRQVEEVTLNAIVRVAREHGCSRVIGTFRPTAKNGMVRELYPTLGFELVSTTRNESGNESVYALQVAGYTPSETRIEVAEKAHVTS